MVAAIRVPKTQRARRELLKHAPKLVSFLLCPSSHSCSLFQKLPAASNSGSGDPGGCPPAFLVLLVRQDERPCGFSTKLDALDFFFSKKKIFILVATLQRDMGSERE
jgi:hypothetical protein